MSRLLIQRKEGLYCPKGKFYIDSLQPVSLNLITHAHSDHARFGSEKYLCFKQSLELLRHRLGKETSIHAYEYGKKIKLEETWVSFHPAGHILGSAQIRVEHGSEVWVVSGDYKRQVDETCDPFEVVDCDTFITESTFGLPIYQWPDNQTIVQEILGWWQQNQKEKIASVLLCYALGKAERILNLLQFVKNPIYIHGSIAPYVDIYKKEGVKLAPTIAVNETEKGHNFQEELILAPLSAANTPWMKRFFPYKIGCASGWMRVRGTRRRMNYDRGFVLSDHADWNDLIDTIKETKAKQVLATHGTVDALSDYLNKEMGLISKPLAGYEALFAEDQ